MIWYRININYLSKDYDNKALEISEPCGNNENMAIKKYFDEIAKNKKCIDNEQVATRVDLTKYIYNKNTNETKAIIINKNY